MKLTTEVIKQILVEQVIHCQNLSLDSEELKIAQDPKAWKRNSKMSVKRMVEYCGFEDDLEEFLECGDETTTLNNWPEVTGNCVARYFVIADITLDCTVVSDPQDLNILCMMWHHD